MVGKVKFFNRVKGFGYIVGDDGRSYFVSHRDIKGDEPFKYLMDGCQVSFEVLVEPQKKEDRAVNVTEMRGNGGRYERTILQ